MTNIILNDVAMEGAVGETLLAVARRNVAHIGFVCDGRGVCATCRCKVHEGADQLTPVNTVELNWLTEAQIADGDRLGCQAQITGVGTIKAISRAEELRRQTTDVFSPPYGTNIGENLGTLLNGVGLDLFRTLVRLPTGLTNISNAVEYPPNLDGIRTYVEDTQRVLTKMIGGTPQLREGGKTEVVIEDADAPAAEKNEPAR